MSIIFALIIFSAIVLFHELGHFLLAKRGGIAVTEFSLGMGPRLWSHEWGGTRYSLKLLPFGGSCLMVGEDGDSDAEGCFGISYFSCFVFCWISYWTVFSGDIR